MFKIVDIADIKGAFGAADAARAALLPLPLPLLPLPSGLACFGNTGDGGTEV